MSASSDAERFFNAFMVLRENDSAIQAEMKNLAAKHNKNLSSDHPPVSAIGLPNMRHTLGVETVCLAFAVELYIKDLFISSGLAVPRSHHIRKLFEQLPESIQNSVFSAHSSGEYGWTLEGFKGMLDMISRGFENYRYLYETNHATYHTGFAVKFIQSLKIASDSLR